MNPAAQITAFIDPSLRLAIEELFGYHANNSVNRGVITANTNIELPAMDRPSLEARLRTLVEAGLIEWSGERLEPTAPLICTKGEKTVAELLIEDRL